ncbi:hypothetical protein [Mycobacterium timonense]|jgi:hypothetical protein|uniref:hypothetical protein n=1 Tax=Mycobacterium timonense TaxID=701043 RepID=UPI0013D54023|nr:hypothetical protein [Mycobacterium timonense]
MRGSQKRLVAIVDQHVDPSGPAAAAPPIVEDRLTLCRTGRTSASSDFFRLYLAAASSGFM